MLCQQDRAPTEDTTKNAYQQMFMSPQYDTRNKKFYEPTDEEDRLTKSC